MNVYDFDETIFTGDTEDRFFKFVFAKKGFRHYKIKWEFYDKLNKLGIITKTKMREGQYKFLKDIDDLDKVLEDYWAEIEQYMKPWYYDAKREDDVIASGTPRFILEPICKKLGISRATLWRKLKELDGSSYYNRYEKYSLYRRWCVPWTR